MALLPFFELLPKGFSIAGRAQCPRQDEFACLREPLKAVPTLDDLDSKIDLKLLNAGGKRGL